MEPQLATKLLSNLQDPLTILGIIVVLFAGWIIMLYRSQGKERQSWDAERQSWNLERQRLQADSKEQFSALRDVAKDSQELAGNGFQVLSVLIAQSQGRGHGND